MQDRPDRAPPEAHFHSPIAALPEPEFPTLRSGAGDRDPETLRVPELMAQLQAMRASLSKVGGQARRSADGGRVAVAQTVPGPGELSARTAKGIDDSRRKFADIVSGVEDIAFQTHILALKNASALVQQVEHVTRLLRAIATAALAQDTGSGQVHQVASQRGPMTQPSAALVEQCAAAAHGLRQQALRLADAVAVFHGGAGPAGPGPRAALAT